MGSIFSRFKKKTAVEQLENVEEEIKELQAFSADTQTRHRNITNQLMAVSTLCCILFSVLIYFYMPQSTKAKIAIGALLVLTQFLYYAVNRMISWYYTTKIETSHSRLKDLQKEKKRLINEIMDTETYKVAKDILEKFAPEALPSKFPPSGSSRNAASRGPPQAGSSPAPPRPIAAPNVMNLIAVRQQNAQSLNRGLPAGPQHEIAPPVVRGTGYVDRLLDYLIGDGPNSRYALICRNCSTHNGMALMEEFEYTAFKCYSCRILNPARKERPLAPKLESDKSDVDEQRSDPDSSSTSLSGDQDNVKAEEVEDEVTVEIKNDAWELDSEVSFVEDADVLERKSQVGDLLSVFDDDGGGGPDSVSTNGRLPGDGSVNGSAVSCPSKLGSDDTLRGECASVSEGNLSRSNSSDQFHPLKDSRSVVNGSSPF